MYKLPHTSIKYMLDLAYFVSVKPGSFLRGALFLKPFFGKDCVTFLNRENPALLKPDYYAFNRGWSISFIET